MVRVAEDGGVLWLGLLKVGGVLLWADCHWVPP